MTATELNALKRKTKKLMDLADIATLREVKAILVTEMEKRAKNYEEGSAKLFTHEEMENNARKAYRDRRK